MKWKNQALIILMLFPYVVGLVHSGIYDVDLARSTEYFRVVLYPNQGLTFQNTITEHVTITPATGIFHTLTGQTVINTAGGYFAFGAIADSTVNITYTVPGVRVRGDQDAEIHSITSGTIITIDNGDSVVIEWDAQAFEYVPMMFILGMIGLVSLMGSPLYGIYAIRKREREGMVTALIMGCLGFGLFIAWLWGI